MRLIRWQHWLVLKLRDGDGTRKRGSRTETKQKTNFEFHDNLSFLKSINERCFRRTLNLVRHLMTLPLQLEESRTRLVLLFA